MAIELPPWRPRGVETIWTTIFFASGLSVDVQEAPAVVDDALLSAAAEFRSAGLTAQEDGSEVRVVPAAVAFLRTNSRQLTRERRRLSSGH